MNHFVIMALIATLGTWLVTALGAATVVFFTSPNPKCLNIMLGFLSVLVHAIRLNTLEFSNHIGLQWTGIFYRPFAEKKDEE